MSKLLYRNTATYLPFKTNLRWSSSKFHPIVSSRPDSNYSGLHYYLSQDESPKTYLSFIPPQAISKGLQPHQIIGEVTCSKPTTIGLIEGESFFTQPEFFKFLHEFLKENIQSDPQLKALAQYQKMGWLHLPDFRNTPPFGRIPEPEDIIGSVCVDKGTIVPNSYQIVPTHRPITPQNGLFQLSEYLQTQLTQALITKD